MSLTVGSFEAVYHGFCYGGLTAEVHYGFFYAVL